MGRINTDLETEIRARRILDQVFNSLIADKTFLEVEENFTGFLNARRHIVEIIESGTRYPGMDSEHSFLNALANKNFSNEVLSNLTSFLEHNRARLRLAFSLNEDYGR